MGGGVDLVELVHGGGLGEPAADSTTAEQEQQRGGGLFLIPQQSVVASSCRWRLVDKKTEALEPKQPGCCADGHRAAVLMQSDTAGSNNALGAE